MQLVHQCWDQLRDHYGPCCMECVIEETNRRAGVVGDISVHETHVRHHNGSLVAVIRACCHHSAWEADTVTSVRRFGN